MAEDRIAIEMIVRGHVQGVGFRALVQQCCRSEQVGGWVRNREDGAVEAELVGSRMQIDAAIARISAARRHQIESIATRPLPSPTSTDIAFEIRR